MINNQEQEKDRNKNQKQNQDKAQNREKLSLYIHIPFCVRKCYYCDFLSAAATEEIQDKYVQALCRELQIQGEKYREYQIDTVFIGGGTPSILSTVNMEHILRTMRQAYEISSDAEITIEVNPGTADAEKLICYHNLGINRLSIGLQSANDEELRRIGRIHTYEEFLNTYETARQVGYDNINIDLMSGLPGQTLKSYEETLEKIIGLTPEHLSAYSLIVEEGTPFWNLYGEGNVEERKNGKRKTEEQKTEDAKTRKLEDQKLGDQEIESREIEEQKPENHKIENDIQPLPNEDTERAMYELTRGKLEQSGYHRYEISNYAKKGYESRHNMGYWQRHHYLGLGLGASSLVQNRRWKNTSDLSDYIEYIEKSTKINTEINEEKNAEANIETNAEINAEINAEANAEINAEANAEINAEANAEINAEINEEKNTETNTEINKIGMEIDIENGLQQDVTDLSTKDQMEEFMFLGLRLMKGIAYEEFQSCFHTSIHQIYEKQIKKGIGDGLLMEYTEKGKTFLRLTLRGIDVSNVIMAEFLL